MFHPRPHQQTEKARATRRAANQGNPCPKAPTLTTTAGAPIADNQNSETAGPRGPLLMQDYQLIEKLAHQNRERIPERTVHAKGMGAHGTFTVTQSVFQRGALVAAHSYQARAIGVGGSAR